MMRRVVSTVYGVRFPHGQACGGAMIGYMHVPSSVLSLPGVVLPRIALGVCQVILALEKTCFYNNCV